jgi:predicted DNA-binding transcriptional regulator YafY
MNLFVHKLDMTTKKPYSQATRVQGILRTLGTRQGTTIGKLAEEFAVTKRTLYRDLKALEEAGYPLLSEVIEGTTYWKLELIDTHPAWAISGIDI